MDNVFETLVLLVEIASELVRVPATAMKIDFGRPPARKVPHWF